jgi:Domain of unknown function (DUF6896)/Protein of unknown function (DUF2185)
MKPFRLQADKIQDLIPPQGWCIASDRITVDGCHVGLMYRELPSDPDDSGWRFLLRPPVLLRRRLSRMRIGIDRIHSRAIGAARRTCCGVEECLSKIARLAVSLGLSEFRGAQFGRVMWSFKKHGLGLCFVSSQGVVVDVHRWLGRPELFDAWRLLQYVESVAPRAQYPATEAELEANLEQLHGSGQIERATIEGGFRLK